MAVRPKNSKDQGFIVVILGIIAAVTVVGVLVALSIVILSKKAAKNDASTTVAAPAPAPPPVDKTKFIFKEYGVQITLPDSLSGLKYRTEQITEYNGQQATALYLSSPDFEATMKKCYGTIYKTMSFGALSKLDGKYVTPSAQDAPVAGTLLKQFDNFYITSGYPNGLTACTVAGAGKDLIFNKAHELYGSLLDSFKTAELVK